MSRRLPWLLFAVSLTANIFFAAGVGYTVYKGISIGMKLLNYCWKKAQMSI